MKLMSGPLMRERDGKPIWGPYEWLMLAAAGLAGVNALMVLQDSASRIAVQFLLVCVYGMLVAQRLASPRLLISLAITGLAAAALLVSAMLTGRWPAAVHDRVAAASEAAGFGVMLFEGLRRRRRAAHAD